MPQTQVTHPASSGTYPSEDRLVFQTTGISGNSKVFDFADGFSTQLQGSTLVNRLEVVGVSVAYTASATAGNRQVCLDLLDANDVLLWRIPSTVNIAANGVKQFYFGQGVNAASVAITGGTVNLEQLPRGMFFCAGTKLRVSDVAAIHSGDSMDITLLLGK